MNIHFFVTYTKDASDSVLAQELKKQGVSFAIFSEYVRLRYKHRAWLYFVGWPRILLYAFRTAFKSLRATPKADWVVLGSHFEVAAFTLMTKILGGNKPKIMLMGFIYTKPLKSWKAKLKHIYFKKILGFVDRVVCHSVQEVEKNEIAFDLKNTRFVYIPYGMNVSKPPQNVNAETSVPYALSAGRSGRDYDLLIKCFTELGYPLHVICDSVSAISEQRQLPPNIQVFRNCYDGDYLQELANAKLVVIPLSVGDISAGQMVLLQAMALSKPVIITKTNTIHHYVEHEKNAVLVEKDSIKEMVDAVKKIWVEPEFADKLSMNAKINFDDNYSMTAHVKNIIEVLERS